MKTTAFFKKILPEQDKDHQDNKDSSETMLHIFQTAKKLCK